MPDPLIFMHTAQQPIELILLFDLASRLRVCEKTFNNLQSLFGVSEIKMELLVPWL